MYDASKACFNSYPSPFEKYGYKTPDEFEVSQNIVNILVDALICVLPSIAQQPFSLISSSSC
jgi:hypothetical protein